MRFSHAISSSKSPRGVRVTDGVDVDVIDVRVSVLERTSERRYGVLQRQRIYIEFSESWGRNGRNFYMREFAIIAETRQAGVTRTHNLYAQHSKIYNSRSGHSVAYT
jgi:hypothetical protein